MEKKLVFVRFITIGIMVLCLVTGLVGCSSQQTIPERSDASQEMLSAEITNPVEEEEVITLETIHTASFADIAVDSQDYDTVCYVSYHGILQGVGDNLFDPYRAVDRATVVTVLHRLSGEEAPDDSPKYIDVPEDSWYADAVAWAAAAGITTGTSEETFSPLEPVTRSQLAALLSRFSAYRGDSTASSGDLSAYLDGNTVQSYAVQPLSWALENGFYRTMAADIIYPDMSVSRLQLAQALMGLQSLAGDELAGEILAALPQKSVSSDTINNHDAIQTAVDSAAEKYGAVGLQVAVVEDGVVTDTYAYGWATKESDPMTADHRLRVASISKVAVGMAAMILKEEGTVDLDASISEYWDCKVVNPSYPDKLITLRSMLMHTSSIINAGDDVSRSFSSVKARLQLRSGFSSAVPGSIGYWNYNNYAYGVLGMTLELASGQYIDDILHQRLFKAMDIDGSFAAGKVQNKDLLTTIYRHDGSIGRSVANQKERGLWEYPGATGAYFAGGLTISSRDLGKLVAMLTQDGRYEGVQMLTEATVAEMEAYDPNPVPGGSYQGISLRYHKNIYGREGLYYHTGSAYGVYNCMSYDPITGDGVVVLTTGASGAKDDFGIYKVCAEISDHIYRTIQ